MIYTTYHGAADLTPQAVNVVINSSCSVAQRTLNKLIYSNI